MADYDGVVLITGATGHLGFAVLKYALQQGFKVRIAVRSQEKAESLKNTSAVREASQKPDQISFVTVPDFLAKDAFDEAVKDAKYIIHVASPLASKAPENPDDWHKFLIEPAVQGTLGVLESAAKVKTVERIVITSSIVAIQPLSVFSGDEKVYDASSRLSNMKAPFSNSFVAYAASKVAAFNATELWVKKHAPQFDVINIHPSFIFGRDDLTDSVERFELGTNKIPLTIALGKTRSTLSNNWNYVGDTARIHVMSLNAKIEGNQSFIVSSTGQDGMTWADTARIVAERFPQAVAEGVLPNNGSIDTAVAKVDVRKTEDTFGFKLASYETAVFSVIEHYLELVQSSK